MMKTTPGTGFLHPGTGSKSVRNEREAAIETAIA